MLIVETIAKIRRAYHRDKKSIRQVAREMNLARNTVRKIIRSDVTELQYERKVQPRPKLEPFKEQLVAALKELKLHGMRSVLDEVLVNGTRQKSIPEKFLLELLHAEQSERKMRSIRYRMGQAKFPVAKDLDQFDFSVSPVNETQVRTLYEGLFLASQTNVILVGGTGTGKTHLAIAIARQIVRSGKRVATSTWSTSLISWSRKS